MARERVVSRTFSTTKAVLMLVDTTTGEVTNSVIELSGKLENEEALKEAKKELENDVLKVVAVVSVEYTDKLIGIVEKDFLAHGKEMDAKTHKFIEPED